VNRLISFNFYSSQLHYQYMKMEISSGT